MKIYCLLVDDYETLDLMGPIEFLFRLPNVQLHYISKQGGLIKSYQGLAQQIANQTEYIWNPDPNKDEFASLYGYCAKSHMTKA